MTEETPVERRSPIVPMLRSDVIGTLLLGGAVGLIIWAFGMLLHHFVFGAYLCQGDIASQCSEAKNYAVVLASIVGAIAALFGLIRLRVYRPLLVVIASLLSLWGVVQMSWNLGWGLGILVAILLYALAFGLYSWVARIREFWFALIVVVVLVVIVRIAFAL